MDTTPNYGSLDECCDANFWMEEGGGCESVDVCAPTPSPFTTDKPVFIWEGGATPFPTPSVSSSQINCVLAYLCSMLTHHSAFMIISTNTCTDSSGPGHT